MPAYHVPKGVSLDTLKEILVGWSAVGAAAEPRYTSAVEDETGVSDAVGRQNRFLEQVDILESEGQKHRLTGIGQALAGALAAGDEERAKARARELLEDWPPTEEIRGLVRENPTAEETLVPLVAAVTGQDVDASRIRSGITTLLDLYEWAGLLERDERERYVLPSGEAEEPPEAETGEEPDKTPTEETETVEEVGMGVEEVPEKAAEMVETEEPVEAVTAVEELGDGREADEAAGEPEEAAETTAEETTAEATADGAEAPERAAETAAEAAAPCRCDRGNRRSGRSDGNRRRCRASGRNPSRKGRDPRRRRVRRRRRIRRRASEVGRRRSERGSSCGGGCRRERGRSRIRRRGHRGRPGSHRRSERIR
ncbi:hypothetical protein ACFQJD_13300 [Haloplanus sp. GCM10025708]|uniref:hypothetical protein n=1 Tax=Haloplanus sp. GCM10025708 TaxID=3252679 RepID=UPI003619329F